MKGKFKKILSIALAFIVIFLVFLNFSNKKVDDFTVEEHRQRITQRIKASNSRWGFPEGEKYQDFEVYPLYNKNEELEYFLVEFEPCNFIIIFLKDEPPVLISFLYPSKSMYLVQSGYYGKNREWSPYYRDKNCPELVDYGELYAPGPDFPQTYDYIFNPQGRGQWILDENGERIFYDKSPYAVTGNLSEKKYLLETDRDDKFIFAVKKDEKFVNLISGFEFEYEEEYSYEEHATLGFTYALTWRSDL